MGGVPLTSHPHSLLAYRVPFGTSSEFSAACGFWLLGETGAAELSRPPGLSVLVLAAVL